MANESEQTTSGGDTRDDAVPTTTPAETASSLLSTLPPPPYRQIRAVYDDTTITVYQAYSVRIAGPAVASQRLSTSPDFQFTRMTWIKPSWCWMMYRSGYSYKDERQARILSIKMKRGRFEHLLSLACVTHSKASSLSEEQKQRPVRVQWDPERDVGLEKLPYRSIQIGIGRAISEVWVNEWIESIEDVTERARAIKVLIDEGRAEEAKDLVPLERPYPVPRDLENLLLM